jgi:uncharacterized peroxidase-related enzyme
VNRLTQLDPAQATGKSKQLFAEVQAKLLFVSNLFRLLGNAPAALEGYLAFSGALAGGSLNARVREQISLAVAESNLCGYCLRAHTFIGGNVGLSQQEIADAIHATATTGETDAILKLARSIIVRRGEISDSELDYARSSGLTDSEIVETVANVVLNVFTNYVSHVARTFVDFPEVKPGQA